MRHGYEDMGPGQGHAPHGVVGPLLVGAIGAIVALVLIRHRAQLKPYLTTAIKELHSFKEWLLHGVEETKEDLEDIVADAKHAYERDITQHLEMLEREKAVLQKLGDAMKRREGCAHA